MDYQEEYGFTQAEWATTLKVLATLKSNPYQNPDNQCFSSLVVKIYKEARRQRRKKCRQDKKDFDQELLKSTEIAQAALGIESSKKVPKEGPRDQLQSPRNCYSCNQPYSNLHHIFHRLCPDCAVENLQQRERAFDLSNRNVLLTGGWLCGSTQVPKKWGFGDSYYITYYADCFIVHNLFYAQ